MSTVEDQTRVDNTPVLHGRIVDVSNLAYVAGIEVGIAALRPDGEKVNSVVRTSDNGEFAIPIPPGPFTAARTATGIDGTEPIELDIENGEIVPGDVVFTVAAAHGSHLRFGGFA